MGEKTTISVLEGNNFVVSDLRGDKSIIRTRAVGNGFHEDVTILNHKNQPVDLQMRLEAAADFADLFEVKDALKKKGEFYQRIESDRLVLGYRREQFVRETLITASAKADIDEHGLSFAVHIEPHGEWTTSLDVVTVLV